jgi:6-hydroxy-3-succinoylpyridine 3-monooxygenase
MLRIYIDGYNLYYGALRQGQFKWLDPIKLVKQVIQESAPPHLLSSDDLRISAKYFTSPVLPKVTFSKTAERDQNAYHSALLATYPENELEIIYGYHSANFSYQRRVDITQPKTLHQGCEKVEVWRIEEKQTDVNIAVEAMNDALTNDYHQHMVFVTNDTDFIRLYETLNTLQHINIGIVTPGLDMSRSPSGELASCSDWLRHYFTSIELDRAQLPFKIVEQIRESSNIKLPIRKPIEWYAQKELAITIFERLFNALGKRNKVYQWLEQSPYPTGIEGLPELPKKAFDMLDDKASAELVLRHVNAYVLHLKNQKK